jgi:signal peptidase I
LRNRHSIDALRILIEQSFQLLGEGMFSIAAQLLAVMAFPWQGESRHWPIARTLIRRPEPYGAKTMKSNVGASQLTETTQTETAGVEKNSASEWREYGLFLLKLAAIVLIFRSFIFAPFNIPSESMHPRLLIGDYLLVSKWPYGISRYSFPLSPPLFEGRIFGSLPERGDVVVVRAPGDANVDYIKRVIGLPGDVVQMRAGTLEINGKPVKKGPRRRLCDARDAGHARCGCPGRD